MRRLSGVLLLLPGLWSATAADVPSERLAIHEGVHPHGSGGGATGICSIAYYNICSGWIWVYSAGVISDEIGVVFDLPNDCAKVPGESCTNTAFWWYWRYTLPAYGYTVTYNLYNVDSEYCKTGPSLGTLANQDPLEQWFCFPGLGTTTSDLVAITATWDRGTHPREATDNNVSNVNAGCAPASTTAHSFYFGNSETQYCPPIDAFNDALGPVQLLMDATFSCEEPSSTEPASWGAVKSLFR